MKTERVTIEIYDIKKQFQSEKKSRELKNGHPRVRACVSRRIHVTSMLQPEPYIAVYLYIRLWLQLLQHCRQLGEFFSCFRFVVRVFEADSKCRDVVA